MSSIFMEFSVKIGAFRKHLQKEKTSGMETICKNNVNFVSLGSVFTKIKTFY